MAVGDGGFKTAFQGFDKNEVNEYISNLRKKMNELEAEMKDNDSKVKAAVKNPLKGKKIGAYYGCLLLRPGKVMEFDDPENPQILEDFIKAIGATPVIYAERNECCGAYASFEDPSIPQNRAKKIITNAQDMGADFLVTSCPLCRYNLIKNQGDTNMDVIYFTELLAEALGIKDSSVKEEA